MRRPPPLSVPVLRLGGRGRARRPPPAHQRAVDEATFPQAQPDPCRRQLPTWPHVNTWLPNEAPKIAATTTAPAVAGRPPAAISGSCRPRSHQISPTSPGMLSNPRRWSGSRQVSTRSEKIAGKSRPNVAHSANLALIRQMFGGVDRCRPESDAGLAEFGGRRPSSARISCGCGRIRAASAASHRSGRLCRVAGLRSVSCA